jgi:hypothetical protein
LGRGAIEQNGLRRFELTNFEKQIGGVPVGYVADFVLQVLCGVAKILIIKPINFINGINNGRCCFLTKVY